MKGVLLDPNHPVITHNLIGLKYDIDKGPPRLAIRIFNWLISGSHICIFMLSAGRIEKAA
jgi:hypothetical protein